MDLNIAHWPFIFPPGGKDGIEAVETYKRFD